MLSTPALGAPAGLIASPAGTLSGSVPTVGRRGLVAGLAEHLAVGHSVVATAVAGMDMVVLGTVPGDLPSAPAVVQPVLPRALAPAAGPGERLVLD